MTSILEEAHARVHSERNYGPPAENFRRTAMIWTAILRDELKGAMIPAWKVGLMMMGLKIARECRKHKRDNLRDAAGYAETVEMIRGTDTVPEKEEEPNTLLYPGGPGGGPEEI